MSANEPTPAAEGGAIGAGAEGGASGTGAEDGASMTVRISRRERALHRAHEMATGHVPQIARATVAERHVGGPALASHTARSTALFAGIALLMAGNGLQNTLLGVRATSEDFGSTVAGLVMTMNFVGFLAGSALAPHLLRQVGHVRVFAAGASAGSSVVLVQAVFVDPLTWGACRFMWGVCFAALIVVAETWLNELATNENRGRMVARYMVITMGAIAAGQLLVAVADTNGFALFAVVSVLVSLALVPMSLSASANPPVMVHESVGLRTLMGTAPTGVVVAFLVGAALGSISGIGSVYAASRGLSPLQVALFVAAPMIGSLFGQIPLGRLSDRVPRRIVIVAAASIAGAACLVMLALDERGFAGIVVMGVMGAFAYPIYSMAVAQTNDWLRGSQRAGASAVLVRMNGVGATVGPICAAIAMSVTLNAFYFVMAAAYVSVAVFVAARMLLVAGPTVAQQGQFLPIPARASAAVAALLRRRR
ncbi:MFS transporter [Candidatus Poriferisodalis sp.]|uniref:MFS transporter n=1 Tax=Candidatus Poriferisodalis sp. TaxID=3101277 RepID=UPI003B5C5EF9